MCPDRLYWRLFIVLVKLVKYNLALQVFAGFVQNVLTNCQQATRIKNRN